MPNRWNIFSLLLCLCLSVFICGSVLGCSKADDANTIYIVSPHASDIRLEFSKAFSAWHKKKYGTEVTVKWPDHGGTQDIMRYLGQQYSIRKDTCGYDLFFGGGSNTFNSAMGQGFLAPPPEKGADGKPILSEIMKNLPPETPLVSFVGVNKQINSEPQWFAGTMSNFGIAINKLRIKELGLPMPLSQTGEPQMEWKDIASPAWFGQLSLADPSKSGSVLTCYEFVLDQYGWDQGWKTLAMMFANCDAVKDGGSNPAEETDLGNTAAGVVIDFFARNHMAKLGTDIMGFVIPEGGAQLDADPIAMLKGAPHPELAGHFIEFVTSVEGQKLWVMNPKTPGGPQFKSLGRLSIHHELYTDTAQTVNLFDKTDPFAKSVVIKTDPAVKGPRRAFLGDLMKCAFVDNHTQLVAAREAIIKLRARDPKRADELEAQLGALPEFEGKPFTTDKFDSFTKKYYPKVPDEAAQTALKDAWREAFRARYEAIRRQAQ